MNEAMMKDPKAAASEASITINAITPAFTAFPIFFPDALRIAASKGLKIIQRKTIKKITVKERVCLVKAKYIMQPVTTE